MNTTPAKAELLPVDSEGSLVFARAFLLGKAY